MPTFRNLTKAQDAAFSLIAVNEDSGHNRRVIKALLDKGLIGQYDEVFPGRPPLTIVRYFVSLDIHIEWCQWCSEHIEEF